MLNRIKCLILIAVLFLAACGSGGGDSAATNYSGVYKYNTASNSVTLTLNTTDNVNYTGTLKAQHYATEYPGGGYFSADIQGKLNDSNATRFTVTEWHADRSDFNFWYPDGIYVLAPEPPNPNIPAYSQVSLSFYGAPSNLYGVAMTRQ